jgi:hypothetical protein
MKVFSVPLNADEKCLRRPLIRTVRVSASARAAVDSEAERANRDTKAAFGDLCATVDHQLLLNPM